MIVKQREGPYWLDVSKWQGQIDYNRMLTHHIASDLKGVVIRLSQGTAGMDLYAVDNIKQCNYNNIPFALYHYVLPSDVEAESAKLRVTIKHLRTYLPIPMRFLALDCETVGVKRGSVGKYYLDFVRSMKEWDSSLPIVIYTRATFWNQYVLSTLSDAELEQFDSCPLWVAHYDTPENILSKPDLPEPWTEYMMWQYGQVSGKSFGTQSAEIDINTLGAHPLVQTKTEIRPVTIPFDYKKIVLTYEGRQYTLTPKE